MDLKERKKSWNPPTHGSSVMEASRNLLDDNDLETWNAPSLLDNPAKPGPDADEQSTEPSCAAVPAVVCARPQFRRRADDDGPPRAPVKLLCLIGRGHDGQEEKRKKNRMSLVLTSSFDSITNGPN